MSAVLGNGFYLGSFHAYSLFFWLGSYVPVRKEMGVVVRDSEPWRILEVLAIGVHILRV